jgi:predicted SprT family Zn-dependent metalloprotease
MDLFKAQTLANELMKQHNLIASGWWFSFDNAKRRFGVCNFGLKKIGLSSHLVKLNDESHVRNTILHEIAHALVGRKHGHDAVWRAKAIEIGCDGNRCYSSEVTKPEARYIGVCPNGHTSRRHKKPNPKRLISCGKCCSTFNSDYLIKWSLNTNLTR